MSFTSKELNSSVGSRIKEERTKRGFSREEFAKILDLSESFIGHLERGSRGTNTENLVLIAKIFNLTLDELVFSSLERDEISFRVTDKVTEEVDATENKLNTIYTYLATMEEHELDFVINFLKDYKQMGRTRKIEQEP